MYTDFQEWKRIRARVLIQGESYRSVAASEGMHRATLRKMIRYERPPGFQLTAPRRSRRLGEHQELLSKLLIDNDQAPLPYRRTSKQLFDDLQKEGYRGNCGPVRYQYMLFNRSKTPTQWYVVQDVVKSLSDRETQYSR